MLLVYKIQCFILGGNTKQQFSTSGKKPVGVHQSLPLHLHLLPAIIVNANISSSISSSLTIYLNFLKNLSPWLGDESTKGVKKHLGLAGYLDPHWLTR